MDNSMFLLPLSQETRRRYWAMEYEQSWFVKKNGGIAIMIFIANSGKGDFESLHQLLNI